MPGQDLEFILPLVMINYSIQPDMAFNSTCPFCRSVVLRSIAAENPAKLIPTFFPYFRFSRDIACPQMQC